MTRIDWPEPQATSGRRVAGWFGKLLSVILLAVLVLSMIGAVYEALEARNDLREYPAPGRMIPVETYLLHAQVLVPDVRTWTPWQTQMGKGSPTVVFDAGLGGSSLDWALVAPEVAKMTRVVVYDRAGMGWSDAGQEPRTSDQIASELHEMLRMLRKDGIEGPYILVGHSFGGYNVRMFYHMCPEEEGILKEDIVGLVLVDAPYEYHHEKLPPEVAWYEKRQNYWFPLYEVLANVGLPRAYRAYEGWRGTGDSSLPFSLLPEKERAARVRLQLRPKFLGAIASESAYAMESIEMLQDVGGPIGRLPLVVLSSGSVNDAWAEMQRELASLSSRSLHIRVERSGHYINIERPEFVVEAIRAIVGNHRLEMLYAPSSPELEVST